MAFQELLDALRADSPHSAFAFDKQRNSRCGLTLRARAGDFALGCLCQTTTKTAGGTAGEAGEQSRARYFEAAVSAPVFEKHQRDLGVSDATAEFLAKGLVTALGTARCEVKEGSKGMEGSEGSAIAALSIELSYERFGSMKSSFTLREIPGQISLQLADAVFAWLPGSCACAEEEDEASTAAVGEARVAMAGGGAGVKKITVAAAGASQGQKRGAPSPARPAQPLKKKEKRVVQHESGVQYEDDSSSSSEDDDSLAH